MADRAVIRCHQVVKTFGATHALKDVSLDLEAGQTLALVGPSGSGKTTLLRMVAGFEVPDGGTINLEDGVVAGNGSWVPPESRRLGMVFQDYALFPHLTVLQNVGFGLHGQPRDSRDKRAREMLEMVHLSEMERRYPYQLSGGEQQRVALARSLAPAPLALLLDEPFSNLDTNLRHELREELRNLLHSNGVTALYVTHDQEEAFLMGDNIAVMNAGRLEQVATAEDIFHYPCNRFVAQFLIRAELIPATVTEEGLVTEVGVVRPPVPVPLGAEFEVSIRPEDVSLRATEEGRGRVVDREFQGMHYLYRIGLPSGAMLPSLQDYNAHFKMGDPVDVYVPSKTTLVCFPSGDSASPDGAGSFVGTVV